MQLCILFLYSLQKVAQLLGLTASLHETKILGIQIRSLSLVPPGSATALFSATTTALKPASKLAVPYKTFSSLAADKPDYTSFLSFSTTMEVSLTGCQTPFRTGAGYAAFNSLSNVNFCCFRSFSIAIRSKPNLLSDSVKSLDSIVLEASCRSLLTAGASLASIVAHIGVVSLSSISDFRATG